MSRYNDPEWIAEKSFGELRVNEVDFSKTSNTTIMHTRCIHCDVENQITLDADNYNRWMAGDFIQDAFGHLTVDQRELIQTGIHSECWNALFPEE